MIEQKHNAVTTLYEDGTQVGVESPMPICVIGGAEVVAVGRSNEFSMVDELMNDVPYLKTNSRFGVSPFTINLTHQDAPLEQQLILDKKIRNQTEEEEKRYVD